MRSVIDSDVPLIVAVQHAKSGLFSNFHFTCFEWVIYDKLFRSESFQLKNLCAAGTEEGPILLLSKVSQSLVPICLLCVHKSPVTDIAMSLQINTFLSVSSDGSIAGWHCQDGTCCFVFENLIPSGEVKISLCQSESSSAWFWVKGKSLSLIDLKAGKVLQYINMPGLLTFSMLQRRMFDSTDLDTAVMATVNSLKIYQVAKNNSITLLSEEEIDFNVEETYYACTNGIVIYKEKTFRVYIYISSLKKLMFSYTFTDIPDHDSIANVYWKNSDSLLIGTFQGYFRIYQIEITNSDDIKQVQVRKTITFSYGKNCRCCIFSKVAYDNDTGVIFSSPANTVICLSKDNNYVKLTIPQNNKLCCIPDPKKRIVIQSEFGSGFQMFDWSKPNVKPKNFSLFNHSLPTSQSVDFHRASIPTEKFMNTGQSAHVTALTCQYVNNPDLKLQIIAGTSDGKMYFFWENSQKPSDIVNALVASIIGIAFLPLRHAGRTCLIAIGYDGSFCLFKWIRLSTTFASNNLPIVSIGFIEKQQLIVVQKIDNSYHVYDIDDPSPLSISTVPPIGTKIVWSRVSFSEPSEISSTLSLNLPESSIFYSVLEITKLQSAVEAETNKEIIDDYKNEVGEIMAMLSPINRRKSAEELQTVNDDGLSFVLIGYRNLPTFFYPMYKLSGQTVFDTAPFNACIHFISYTLMSEFLSQSDNSPYFDTKFDSKIGGFISILTQFLYVTDVKVQAVSALTCIRAIDKINDIACNEMMLSYIQYFDKNNLADYDKYLMGILMVNHSEIVPHEYHKTVFNFLMTMAKSDHISVSLALAILLTKFDLWTLFANPDALLINLIKYYFNFSKKNAKTRRATLVKTKLQYILSEKLEIFAKSVNSIISEMPLLEIAQWICQLCMEVSQKYADKVGTSLAIIIAQLGNTNNQFIPVFDNELRNQQSLFGGQMACCEQTWAIATNDGNVHIFQNLKNHSVENLFEGPISYVSVGPKAVCAAAVSKKDNIIKVFSLKKNIFTGSKQHIVSAAQIRPDCVNFDIEWTGKDECQVNELKRL